jgi:hypothetical protein
MPSIALKLEFSGDTKLTLLREEMTFPEKLEFADQVAGGIEELTRSHIATAAATRHTTAQRLGATPTNYLLNKASSVEALGTPGSVLLTVSGDIFKRTFQPVTVTAVNAKMLTIPWSAEAYGKRAGEFSNLFVYVSKKGDGQAFLAQRDGKTMKFLFLLKRSVVLPQDRGLLPADEEIFKVVEQAADDKLKLLTQKLAAQS